MKKLTTSFLSLLLIVAVSGATELANKPYFGLEGGLARYHGDFDDVEYNTGGGVFGGYWLTNNLALELSVAMNMLKCSGDNSFQTIAKSVAPMLKYRFMQNLPFNPYLTLGLE